MRKISAFSFLTVNGFYKGKNNDISWHEHGEEGNDYSIAQLGLENILLFGRKTFDVMFSYWPTSAAAEQFPKVAKMMNEAEKIVVSNTLTSVKWKNTRILTGDLPMRIKEIKDTDGRNTSILGSGSLVTQLTDAGLIDEYEFLIDPIVMGKGTSLFDGIQSQVQLTFLNKFLKIAE